MILFDTPRPVTFRRFKTTAHCSSDLVGPEATEELLAFGRRIGLRDAWLQHRGLSKEHFDLFDGVIARARRAGAVEVPSRVWFLRCVKHKRTKGVPR